MDIFVSYEVSLLSVCDVYRNCYIYQFLCAQKQRLRKEQRICNVVLMENKKCRYVLLQVT